MAGNRKAAEQEILSWVADIDKSGSNTEYYKSRFKELTDKQFEKWIEELEAGRDYLHLIVPNIKNRSITTDNNKAVAKKRGVPFFERVWVTGENGQKHLSNIPYPVLMMQVKRQIESIENKRSIPSISTKKKDDLTGQVSGDAASMTLSLPETQIMYAMGLEAVVVESLKYRGGDVKGGDEFDRALLETGEVSINALLQTETRVKSSDTLKSFLIGMHYENNL